MGRARLHKRHRNPCRIGERSQLVIRIKGNLDWRGGSILTVSALEIAGWR